MKRNKTKGFVIKIAPLGVLLMFFYLLPLLVFLLYSFWTKEGYKILPIFTLKNYLTVFQTKYYLFLLVRSVGIGLLATILTIFIAYPLAYTIRFRVRKYKNLCLILIMVSLMSSYLVRVYAWRITLGISGILNSFLLFIHLIDAPLEILLYSPIAVLVTFVQIFIPYMFICIYSEMININPFLIEASKDLGGNSFITFWKITFPLSLKGVITGSILIFFLTTGDYVTPALVGGVNGMMIGRVIKSQFGLVFNWPLGSAITFIMLFFILLFVMFYSKLMNRIFLGKKYGKT